MCEAKQPGTNDGWWERQRKGCYPSFIWFALITPWQAVSSRGIISGLPLFGRRLSRLSAVSFPAPPRRELAWPSAVLAHLIPLMALKVMSECGDRWMGRSFASHSNLVIKLNFLLLYIWCPHLWVSVSAAPLRLSQAAGKHSARYGASHRE